jgi:hypothetical protein
MTDSVTLSYVAELKREFQSLRTEMHEGFASERAIKWLSKTY